MPNAIFCGTAYGAGSCGITLVTLIGARYAMVQTCGQKRLSFTLQSGAYQKRVDVEEKFETVKREILNMFDLEGLENPNDFSLKSGEQ